MRKAVWRTAVAGAVAGMVAAGMLAAAPAWAHVSVNPSEASQGGFARLDFRVPNESDTESTTELEVHFPEEAPIPSASVAPMPGWSVEVTLRTLDQPIEGGHGEQITDAVDYIIWTADSDEAAIGPGEFLEFPVSAGPMPEVDELFFRALQTYSDGTVVRWIELPAGDGAEAAFPAPMLRLVAGGGPGAGDAGGEPAAPGEESAAEETGGGGAGVWLGLAGLVAGLAGLAMGGAAFARARQ